jgi:hypothetical protein
MWNISSLAQRAKDAAAQIEHQINDSIGGVQEEKMSNPDQQEETTDGYLNVEEECVSFSERDEDATHCDIDKQPKSMRQRVESAPSTGEISFVDLKSAVNSAADDDALEEALGRIDSLEQNVKCLEEQLLSAKEESEKYYASNLELMEHVRVLKEENNKLLKDNSLSKEKE